MKKFIYISVIIGSVFLFVSCIKKTSVVEHSKVSSSDIPIEKDLNRMLVNALNVSAYKNVEDCIEKGADVNIFYKDEPLLYYLSKKEKFELAAKAIEHGADIQWCSPTEKMTAFAWAIQYNNLTLGKALLDKGVDLSCRIGSNRTDYLSLCIERQSFSGNKLYLNYDFASLFLDYEYVRNYLKNWEGTLYKLIYRWTEKTPELIDLIYGPDYCIPDNIPVLLISIPNKEALEYFIERGVEPNKEYYDSEADAYFTPLEYAMICRNNLTHYHGGDMKYDEDSPEVKNIDSIIEYLDYLNVNCEQPKQNLFEDFYENIPQDAAACSKESDFQLEYHTREAENLSYYAKMPQKL